MELLTSGLFAHGSFPQLTWGEHVFHMCRRPMLIWHPVCDACAEKGTNLELCADWCTLRVSPNPPKTGPARNGCVYCKRTPSGVPLKRTFKMHGLFGLHVKRGLQIDDSLKPTVRRLNMVEPTHTHTPCFSPLWQPAQQCSVSDGAISCCRAEALQFHGEAFCHRLSWSQPLPGQRQLLSEPREHAIRFPRKKG